MKKLDCVSHHFSTNKNKTQNIDTPYLASNIFLDKQIFALVAEDDVNFLSARTTDIRSFLENKHKYFSLRYMSFDLD